MGRHLISLIDGTRVSASQASGYASYSNVYELAHLLQLRDQSDDGRPQVVFYSSGISSQPDTRDFRDLITGNTIQSQIIDQYTSICANYDFSDPDIQKDKIYIFGFSRGAMAARALAALISEYGLLNPKHIRDVPEVIKAWQNRKPASDEIDLHRVEIEFVGIFDAVMGGIERMAMFNPIRFPDHELSQNVKHAVHILSIDENRRMFKPKPWSSKKEILAGTLFKQVWMPGVHSDVGGTANSVWGRSSLLAMIYYVDKYTNLTLDENWVKRKRKNLKESVDNNKIYIDLNKTVFSTKRKPFGKNDAREFYHPIVDMIKKFNYQGKSGYPWKEKIFEDNFGSLNIDSELESYFRSFM